ncbi:MAG: DUF1847 domain-containing protein [Lentimicrobiaceae bacterium]|jgi:uncharacterized metal-binding protein
MNCTTRDDKVCHKQQNLCSREIFDKEEVISQCKQTTTSEIVEAAAELVDFGRAGSLSRVEEIREFAATMNYKTLGLAYCYSTEQYANAIETVLNDKGFDVSAVSCSVGGLKQSEVNSASYIHTVSFNPLGQAEQLNTEKVDLALVVGKCMGHDILLNRNLGMDFTTLVVKDRKYNHAPLLEIEK